jgi:hypothetical protein
MQRKKAQKRVTRMPADPALRSAFLDLHEPISEVRALAELILVLREAKEPPPNIVFASIWKILINLDIELRARFEVVRTILGMDGSKAEPD